MAAVINYFTDSLVVTGSQLFILFGPLLLIAITMHFAAAWQERMAFAILGEKVFVYGFKMIGTPVHELGHLIFSFLFGHKIVSVKWFDPQGKGGSYGYVKTRYNKRNPFHETGRFFSGIGPVLMCAIMLYAITWMLFGVKVNHLFAASITAEAFTSLSAAFDLAKYIAAALQEVIAMLFQNPGTPWWKVVLFLYLFFSIGSSMTLSPPDLQQTIKGFLYVAILLLLFNLATLWTGGFLDPLFSKTATLLSVFLAVMMAALIIQFLFNVVLTIIATLKRLFTIHYRL